MKAQNVNIRTKKPPLKEFGTYKLLAELSHADEAELWLAKPTNATQPDQRVVIKPLTPLSGATPGPVVAQNFEGLTEALSRLDHPVIWPVINAGSVGGCYYVVLPYHADALSLQEQLEQVKLAPVQVVDLVEQVLEGLDFAHRRGVMHGSLSPANILLFPVGPLALRNFGLAKFENDNASATLSLLSASKPQYLAPEQFVGCGDFRSDLYAAGVIIYQLLTGNVPFNGETSLEISKRHLNEALPLAQLGLPRPLEQFLGQALAKNPADRFASAYEMAEAFAQVSRFVLAQAVAAPVPLPVQAANFQPLYHNNLAAEYIYA